MIFGKLFNQMKQKRAEISGNFNTIVINGKKFSGHNVYVVGNDVYIDDQLQTGDDLKTIEIQVIGNADKVMTSCGDIRISGNVDNVSATSGDIDVAGDSKFAQTVSGDIFAHSIERATSVSGDIKIK